MLWPTTLLKRSRNQGEIFEVVQVLIKAAASKDLPASGFGGNQPSTFRGDRLAGA